MDESTGDQTPTTIWLTYSLTRSIKPALRRQFIKHYPDPADLARLLSLSNPVLDTNDNTFNKVATHALQQRFTKEIENQVHTAIQWEQASKHHHIIGLNHSAYPKALLATNSAPPVLYVNGRLASLNTPCIAIVGARKATHGALEIAREIAEQLAMHGITIVSGLALGIDAAAHQGALHGSGETIAVSATGPEQIYPRSHQKLAQTIVANGAIVTEFPLNTHLQPHCFPRRNRIISGMSHGVLVVEAALPSGTLTTAQHALRQGREVMAVPGAVQNPMARGCHELLKNGAALIEKADDVINCLSAELRRHVVGVETPKTETSSALRHKKLTSAPPDALTLLDCLGFDPVNIDTLTRRSGLNASRVAGALTHLELAGVIVADHVGRYTRCKDNHRTREENHSQVIKKQLAELSADGELSASDSGDQ